MYKEDLKHTLEAVLSRPGEWLDDHSYGMLGMGLRPYQNIGEREPACLG